MIYEKVIVEHAKQPHNFGPLEGANRSAEGVNPLCGDELRVELRTTGDRIDAAAFHGAGCAVCVASASLMTLAVTGLSAADAARLTGRVRDVVAGGQGANLGALEALAGVARFPARQKCALLAWRALEAALAGEEKAVSTELS
jgi:nitrogen fixation NifU-like protein